MRLVHLSDLHLGFRQFQRLTPGGINQREADIARSFQQAIDRIIALSPELVLVAGDVFHNVRPTNPAILHAFNQFSRLKHELPEALVIVIAGNHDTPRAAETGCILRLFQPLGIRVVDGGAERLAFPELDLSVLAVPDIPGPHPALVPDPAFRYNVLLLHGEIEGILPGYADGDRVAMQISRAELGVSRWSYVALGHYHVYREIAPNAFYSGALDYASSNIWGELHDEVSGPVSSQERSAGGKGFVEFDLQTGEHEFHRLVPSRELVDLPWIQARGLSAAEVDAQMRNVVEHAPHGIDGRIVRVVIRDLPRHIARELDHKQIRDYKRRALHFQVDVRRPELFHRHASGAPAGRRPSLLDVVREKLQARVLESDIDRETLVVLGLRYLREAEHVTASAPVEA